MSRVYTGKESVVYDTQLPEGIDSVQHIQDMEEAAYRYTVLLLSLSFCSVVSTE